MSPAAAHPPAPGRWALLGALLMLPSVAAWLAGPGAALTLAWQPELAFAQPWRWWSAAWVHWSRLHLLANLAGSALVVALGWTTRVPSRAVLAWALAWPLTQLGLLLQPALHRYGGLSGVLHAGVAVVAVHLAVHGHHAQRWLAAGIAAGLLFKLVGEAAWQGPLAYPAGWDIAVAPLAHVTGSVAGAVLGALLLAAPARSPQ